MSITATSLQIPDVLLLEPSVHEDERGAFVEIWNERDLADAIGTEEHFVQDNQSRSRAGVVRGLHYQLPQPQGKLVRVGAGVAFTVAVDLRRSSVSFGQTVTTELSADNRRQLWIPAGFAHGFMALASPTDVLYKVTAYFAPHCDRELRWNDPALGIEWPMISGEPMISNRDRGAPLLASAETYA